MLLTLVSSSSRTERSTILKYPLFAHDGVHLNVCFEGQRDRRKLASGICVGIFSLFTSLVGSSRGDGACQEQTPGQSDACKSSLGSLGSNRPAARAAERDEV